jgi:hypothetical protein
VETETIGNRVYENLPSIIGAIAMIMLFVNYFVEGGIQASNSLRTWLGLAMPFVEWVTTIFLVRVHVQHVARRDPRWWQSIVFFAFFLIPLAWGLANGSGDPYFGFVWELFGVSAVGAIFTMFVMGFSLGFIRTYSARSPLRVVMMLFSILALAYGAGLLGSVPFLADLYLWITNYFVGQANFGVWLATHIGTLALLCRIVILKEKLRPY